jgi:hypothetical protein
MTNAAGPSIERRSFLLGGVSLALAGCVQTLMSSETAQSVVIREISVSTAQLSSFSVRGLPLSQEQFANDLRRNVSRALGDRASPDGNADLVISVTRVLLKGPELALIAGGPSFIDARVLVRSVADGTPIAGPMTFSGMARDTRLGGIVGAATTPPAEEDYLMTLEGFAIMLNEALFEGGTNTF